MTIEDKINALCAAIRAEVGENPSFANRLRSVVGAVGTSAHMVRGVTEDCIEFYDPDQKIGINLVPRWSLQFLPKVGEFVVLPGQDGKGHGTYQVKRIMHLYVEDDGGDFPNQARLFKITIEVQSLKRRSGRRARSVLDPFAIHAEGEDVLRARLRELDIEKLKDIIAEHGMDTARLAMKWKSKERLLDLIATTVQARSRKGDAFRGE